MSDDFTREDAEERWRLLRNATVQCFRDFGDDPPDAEEIAIQMDRGYETPDDIRLAILADRRGESV